MRIPTTESRRGLDTGAGALSTPRLTDAVGPSLRSLGGAVTQLAERYQRQQDAVGPSLRSPGGAVTQLAERYQRQQDADQVMRARKSFLDFQSDVRADYEAALENAPENGAGLHESWIVGTEDEPGVFDQRALGFIAALPESLRGEYMARVEQMRDGYDDQLARDQLEISQSFSNSVITQQMEVSVAAINRNPGTFEDQLEDVTALVVESGLPVSQAVELLQASEQQLAMIAARAEMERDPDGFGQALDDHQGRYGARRIDAAFEAVGGGETDAAVDMQPGDQRQADGQNPERPIATPGTMRSGVGGAFEDAEQGEEGREDSGSPYDSILQHLEPSQIDDLRFELEDARFGEKRRADYNAAALRRTLDENLKSIRDTGWPAQEIDALDVKSLLGEEEAEKYETGRTVARTVYRAVQATAGLPEEEVRPEIENIVRRSGVDPSSAEAVTVEALQQQQMQQRLQEEDRAQWAMRHPNVQDELSADIWTNPEDMERFIDASLTAQSTPEIAEGAAQPIPDAWTEILGRNLNAILGYARREGIAELDAMHVAVDSIRGRFGERYAEQVTAAAIATLRDPGDLPALAHTVFSTAQLAAGGVAPMPAAGSLVLRDEPFVQDFASRTGPQRAQLNAHISTAMRYLNADYWQVESLLEDMPRMAWPPFDVASMSDSELSALGERPWQDDPVRFVMYDPEVQAAQEGLDVSDRASVSALITSLESAQQNAGIAQADRRPISERWMWHLSNGLAGFLGVAESRGVDPYDAMRLSFDVFRDVVGQQEAGRVFLSALQSADAPPNRLARAQRVIANAEPFDANLAPGALITPDGLFGRFPGLESALRNGYDASFGERVRRTFRLAVGELDQMPRANGLAYGSEDAWPPFDVEAMDDQSPERALYLPGGWLTNPTVLLPPSEELGDMDSPLAPRSSSRLFSQIVTSFAGLTETEMLAELDRFEASGVGSNTDVLIWARQAIPRILRWRIENPALAFETEVLALSSPWGPRSSVLGRYRLRDSMRWQEHVGIPEWRRAPLSNHAARLIASRIQEFVRLGGSDNKMPEDVMRVAIEGVSSLLTNNNPRHAMMLVMSQIHDTRDRQLLSGIADQMLDETRDSIGRGGDSSTANPRNTFEGLNDQDDAADLNDEIDHMFNQVRGAAELESIGIGSRALYATEAVGSAVAAGARGFFGEDMTSIANGLTGITIFFDGNSIWDLDQVPSLAQNLNSELVDEDNQIRVRPDGEGLASFSYLDDGQINLAESLYRSEQEIMQVRPGWNDTLASRTAEVTGEVASELIDLPRGMLITAARSVIEAVPGRPESGPLDWVTKRYWDSGVAVTVLVNIGEATARARHYGANEDQIREVATLAVLAGLVEVTANSPDLSDVLPEPLRGWDRRLLQPLVQNYIVRETYNPDQFLMHGVTSRPEVQITDDLIEDAIVGALGAFAGE